MIDNMQGQVSEEARLIFLDEKECRQVCSTIILGHCREDKTKALYMNIGKTLIQRADTNYPIKLCSESDIIGHLKILTQAELAMNAWELMKKSLPGTGMGIEETYTLNRLVFGNLEIFPDSIVFITDVELDIKNLRFDVDRVEVRILKHLEVSETFDVQSMLYGNRIQMPKKDRKSGDVELEGIESNIFPFIYIYFPHLFAHMLRKNYSGEIHVDLIGVMRLTGNYVPLAYTEKLGDKKIQKIIGDKKDIINNLMKEEDYEKLCTKAPMRYKENKTEKIRCFVEKVHETLSKDNDVSSVQPLRKNTMAYINNNLKDELRLFNFGIQPIAIWRIKGRRQDE